MPVILVSMINTGARSAMRTTGGLTGGLADCDPRTTRPRRAPDATTPTRTLPVPAPCGAAAGAGGAGRPRLRRGRGTADHRSLRWDAFGLRCGRGWCRGR